MMMMMSEDGRIVLSLFVLFKRWSGTNECCNLRGLEPLVLYFPEAG